MPDWLKGFLTIVIVIGHGALDGFLINLAFGEPLGAAVATLIGGGFGFLYGVEAGSVVSYNLNGIGWLQLLVDMTWSLPNTIFGFVLGNIIYIFFGFPDGDLSKNRGFIAFKPYGGGGFGNKVLQTLGTINLGGAGQHELTHVLQARIFGPLFLPLFGLNYVINFLAQGLWTITLGWVLYLVKIREKPYFRPSDKSVVSGFFGWIYYYTVFEYWGYNT